MHLRACGGQFAHAPSRRRADCAGSLVTRDAACGAAAARKAVHPVISLPARLRRASRAPCLCFRPVSHARDCFQVRARARLLFSQTSRDPVSCSLRRGGNPPGESPGASPTHRNARKAELCSLAFRAFPLSAGGLRPERPRKPASSERKGEIDERAQASPFAQKRLKS